MHFVLKIVVVTLCSFNLAYADSIEVKGPSGQYESLVSKVLDENIQPVISSLSKQQQQQLNQVIVELSDAMPLHAMAFSFPGEQPIVRINDRFLFGIEAFVESYLLSNLETAAQTSSENSTYFDTFFSAEINGIKNLLPSSDSELFQTLDKAQLATFKSRKQEILEGVVLDMVSHELGHHATSSFYHSGASAFLVRQNEVRADRWALQQHQREQREAMRMGRLMVMGFLLQRQRWMSANASEHYPEMLGVIAHQIQSTCTQADDHLQPLCKQLTVSLYDILLAAEFIVSPFSEQLAKKNFVDACNYFNESFVLGQVARAAIYVGWCYQKGYLESAKPEANVFASR